MKKPSFCVLLDLGVWVCLLMSLVGLVALLAPVSTTATRLAGLACIVQFGLMLGVQMALGWIVEKLSGSTDEPIRESSATGIW